MVLFGIYFTITYKSVQFATLKYLSPTSVGLWFEPLIPFVPIFFIIYSAVYILPSLTVFMIQKREDLILMMKTYYLVSLIHYGIFLLYPVYYRLRPALSGDSLFDHFGRFYYTIDLPVNCFPSMHVSFVFLSYFFLLKEKSRWTNFYLISAIAISISTLLVKQHYMLDVVVAMALAWAVDAVFISRRINWWSHRVLVRHEAEF